MPLLHAMNHDLRLCGECYTFRHHSRIKYHDINSPLGRSLCEVCLESPFFEPLPPFIPEPCANILEYLQKVYDHLEKVIRSFTHPCVFRKDSPNFDVTHPSLVAAYHKLKGPKPLPSTWFCHLDFQMNFDEFVEEFVFSTGQSYQLYREGIVELGRCLWSGQEFNLVEPHLHPWPLLRAPWRGMVPDNVTWVTPDVWEMKMRHFQSNNHEMYAEEEFYPSKGLRLWQRLKKYFLMRTVAFYWEEKVLRARYAPKGPAYFASLFNSCDMVECL